MSAQGNTKITINNNCLLQDPDKPGDRPRQQVYDIDLNTYVSLSKTCFHSHAILAV